MPFIPTRALRLFCIGWIFMWMLAAVAQAQNREALAAVAPYAKRQLDVHALKVSEKSGRIPVTLPDGTTLRFVPTSQRVRGGVTSLRAVSGSARLLLTTDGGNAFGYVATDTAHFRITTVDRQTFVVDADSLAAPIDLLGSAPGKDTLIDPEFVDKIRGRMQSQSLGPPADAVYSVVDIAIFLDPAITALAGPQAQRTLSQAFVDFTNEAFIANNIQAELNLVLVEPFAGAFDPIDPFPGFASDAAMHARADLFGADLRHLLFVVRPGMSFCGQGYLVGATGISGYQCGAGTFAHEIGHNFGAHHDRANATSNVNLPISAYNFGFVCDGAATIMSYVGTPRLSHYSDPALTRGGLPCGVAFDQPDGAHNGHAIEVMRAQIEAIRSPQIRQGTIRFTSAAASLQEDGEAIDIVVARDGDLSLAVSVEVATVDDTAEEQLDYIPVLTRLEFAANEASKIVRIEPLDDEEFEQDESFRVVLRYPLSVALAGAPMAITLSSEDLDRGKAEVEIENVSVWENGGPVTLNVIRTGTATHELTVGYSTADGSATAGQQYQAVSGSMTFAAGETSKSVSIPIIDNDRYEQPTYKSFALILSGNNLGTRRTQMIHVFNDDPNRGRSEFAAVSLDVPETQAFANVTIRRIEGSEATLFVEYSTVDGTAVAGRDYVSAGGSFTFSAGETMRVIPVQLRDNARFDGNRTFTMTMSGQAVADAITTTVNIINDDPNRGLAQFVQATQDVNENAGAVEVAVQRVGGTEDTLTVAYATESGSAQSPRDFQSTSGQLSFAPGVTSMMISIPIVDNIFYGAGNEFTLSLSGELVGTSTVSTVRIVNDDPNRGRAQFQSSTASVGEGAGTASLTVTRIEGTESTLSVSYATSDGTGRAGIDYQAASGVLMFAAGEVSKVLDITVLNNSAVDSSRAFNVTLTGDFVGSTAVATVTIANDDVAPIKKDKGGGGGLDGLLLLGLMLILWMRCSKSQRRIRELTRSTIDVEDGQMNHSQEQAGSRLLGIALCCALLQACGGGGEGDGPGPGPGPNPGNGGWSPPPAPVAPPATGSTATGVFRDANVQGVAYTSGTLSGVTGADGRFQYIAGSPVTFSVGAVTLGSFAGQPFITPLHLPTSTTSSIVDQIENRLRFLQMLDLDGNPENGIEISESTRTRADNWAAIDFTMAGTALPAALATIRADAASADGGTHAIPAASAASEHFVRTVRCTYSGLYRGTYSGSDTGIFAIVSYGAGRMRGLGYSTIDDEGFLLEKTTDLTLSFTPDFQAGTGSNGATFSGEYVNPSEIRGNWSNGADTGTFVGARSGGSDAAIYRITGFQFPVGTALVMSFEINAANEVTGSIIDLDEERDGVPITLTGSLAGTAFTANAAAGQYSITGTFNPGAAPASRSLTGTLRDNIKGRDVVLQVPGCKLN